MRLVRLEALLKEKQWLLWIAVRDRASAHLV
jgi:hypothetical protein